MKQLFKFATALMVMSFAMTTYSCSEEPNEGEGSSTANVELTVAADAATASSVPFSIKSTGFESYAYSITEGELTEPSEGVVIYNDADEVFDITSDATEGVIYDLEGATAYTVEFAFKVAGKEEYVVKSAEFTTTSYDQLVTVVEASFNQIKFHINAPEGRSYRYLIMSRFDRASAQAQWGTPDSELLHYAATGVGPQLVTYKDGDPSFLSYEGEEVLAIVRPGASFVIMVAECDEKGDLLGNYYLNPAATEIVPNAPLVDGYAETHTAENFNAMVYLCAKLPSEAAGEVGTTIKTSETTATINYAPSEEVNAYAARIFSDAEMGMFYDWAGEYGIGYEMQRMTSPLSGEVEVKYTGLKLGEAYTLVTIHTSDKAGETAKLNFIPFETTESKLPAVELEITDAGSEDPYSASFNIKCPSKNCGPFKYMMNTAQAWSTMLAAGLTYETMFAAYDANTVDIEEIITAINSDEGYTMTFDSWENTENVLAILAANADDKTTCSYGSAFSAKEQADERVESELFETLLGDWTTTYTFKPGWELNQTTSATHTSTFKTEIAATPDRGPATFGAGDEGYSELYDYFVKDAIDKNINNPEKFATDQIAALFVQYKESAERFAAKYREQNRLVMIGFTPYKEYSTIDSWDLFLDTNYGAYDMDQLFFDYGPKMFLHINADGTTEIETNPKFIAPARNYDQTYYIGAVSCTSFQGMFDRVIPVSRANEDEMCIEGLSYTFDDGRVLDNFFLSFYYYDAMGTPYPSTVGFAAPTMKRGYTEPEPETESAPSFSLAKSAQAPAAMSQAASGRFKRTFMPSVPFTIKETPKMSVDCAKDNLEAYVAKLKK